MPELRVGTGYDVHAFSENRKLILGGVEIPYTKGLMGHSDADVLIHAIMDALLGAAGLPDIGRLFPDTSPDLKDISSLSLLENVMEKLREKAWAIVNIDATIICQAPKLMPYIDEMRSRLAVCMAIDDDRINIKATTTEHLGFTGRGEGIAAEAVCLLQK